MRRVFISVFFLGTFCSAQTSTAQQMLPEREPSLADQAQAAKKPPAEKAKIVVDNDTLEHRNRGSIPDLGSPDLEVNTVVDKIVQYRDSHPKDDAKQVINGWFLDQKSRIEQLNQQEKLYFEFSNRSAAPGAAYEVWNRASVAENYRRGSEEPHPRRSMEAARPLARAIRKGPRPFAATRHSERMDSEGAG